MDDKRSEMMREKERKKKGTQKHSEYIYEHIIRRNREQIDKATQKKRREINLPSAFLSSGKEKL